MSMIHPLIKKIYRGIYVRCSIFQERCAIYYTLHKKKSGPTIFLFGSPRHSNMGDQAQTYCIIQWIKKNYPQHKTIIFNYSISTDKILARVRKIIQPQDLIFFHSGYHLTDLYREKEVYCKVLQKFPDYHILCFPQTINFIKNKADEQYVSNIFNKHKNITLCCRDEISYQNAQKIFTQCKLLLFPDIVTSLIGNLSFSHPRQGVLFCMRNDIEALYSPKQIQNLRAQFVDIKTELTDTTIKIPYTYIRKHREEILHHIFDQYAHYKVVITDRYHGTIFSLIAGTPVIVLSSTDHKLSSGVKWFPASFSKYVYYAENLSKAYDIAQKILNDNTLTYQLPPYFTEHYYAKLKDLYESM